MLRLIPTKFIYFRVSFRRKNVPSQTNDKTIILFVQVSRPMFTTARDVYVISKDLLQHFNL